MFEFKRIVEPNLFGVEIQPNSIYCGIDLNKIPLPQGCAILGILRNKQIIAIAEEPVIYVGDYILAMAMHPMMTPALKVTLKQTHRVYCSLNACLLESKPTKMTNLSRL